MGDLVIFFGKNLFSTPNLLWSKVIATLGVYVQLYSLLTQCKILDVVSFLHCSNYPTSKRHMDLP